MYSFLGFDTSVATIRAFIDISHTLRYKAGNTDSIQAGYMWVNLIPHVGSQHSSSNPGPCYSQLKLLLGGGAG